MRQTKRPATTILYVRITVEDRRRLERYAKLTESTTLSEAARRAIREVAPAAEKEGAA